MRLFGFRMEILRILNDEHEELFLSMDDLNAYFCVTFVDEGDQEQGEVDKEWFYCWIKGSFKILKFQKWILDEQVKNKLFAHYT